MGSKRDSRVSVMFGWLRKRSMKVKIFLGILLAFCAIVVLKHTIREPNFFFKASETVHIIGLIVLIYKLYVHKSCSGLSLKSQELTALFLATRLVGRAYVMANLHSVLDLILLLSTLLVIWLMRFKLKSSYIKEFDNMWISLLVAFCAILAIIIHPLFTQHSWIARVFWVFPTYLETISILPQLRYMQNAKTYDTRGKYLFFFGHGYFWMLSLFLSEIIQSFILADFCYYYIKSFMQGKLLRKMPV